MARILGDLRVTFSSNKMIQHTSSYEDDQGRKDKANDEQSSQRTIHNPTKDHMDLTKGVEHKPSHKVFFLLIFL